MKNNYSKVIDILKKNLGKYFSGEKIAKLLNTSRVAVYKIIKNLIKEGYKIEKKKNLGYKLISIPFSPQELLKENLSVVKKVYHYKTTTSTMDVAKQILKENPNAENVLVVADKQLQGRGRLQRSWFSPEGGLWFSLILRPKVTPDKIFFLNYVFSLSVVNTLRKYLIDAKTKWPNDVVIDSKKICGILIETDAEIDKVNWCIVGVGVNVNIKKEFFVKNKLQATSVYAQLNKEVDLTEFTRLLFKEIEHQYKIFQKEEYKKIVNQWCKYSSTIGENVEVITINGVVKGKALGIDNKTGALLVKTRSGKTEHVLSGDCIHLRR